MDNLSLELFDEIALDELSYRALIAIPRFARTLTIDRIFDFQITFGHSVKITAEKIAWHRNGKLHRLCGPAIIYTSGDELYYNNGFGDRLFGSLFSDIRECHAAQGCEIVELKNRLKKICLPKNLFPKNHIQMYKLAMKTPLRNINDHP